MKISILTACYNCAPYLKECINSVRSQRHQDWEMVIVNDKSNDQSLSIMQKFDRKDSRIRIINNPSRLKCGGSYKVAMDASEGDICCVIDADDALASSASISQLVQKYEEYPNLDYIWTQFYICDPSLRRERKGSCACPNSSLLEAGIRYNKFRHAFSHWRTFRSSLKGKGEIFNPNLPAAVDKWMGYTLEEIGHGGFFPKALYLYRRRIGGLSFTGRNHWKRMLNTFQEKRKRDGITPFPIIKVK